MPKRARDVDVLHESVPGAPRPTAEAASKLLFALHPGVHAVPKTAYEHTADDDRHHLYLDPAALGNPEITDAVLDASLPPGAMVTFVLDGRPLLVVRPESRARSMARDVAAAVEALALDGDALPEKRTVEAAALAREALMHTEAPRYADFRFSAHVAREPPETVCLRYQREEAVTPRLELSTLARALVGYDVGVRVKCLPESVALYITGRRRIAARS